jgi:hypothetical protein
MDSPKQPARPNPAYETKDISLRLVVIFLAGLAILIAISLLVLWGMYTFLANRQASRMVPLPPLAESQQPPEPRLQPAPSQELKHLRAEEEAVLNSYGWINKEAGVVRIPIERAMELTLERGLPTRPGD